MYEYKTKDEKRHLYQSTSHSSRHFTNFSNFGYRTKLSHLAFLANALSTSFVGPCSRWHCSKRSAFSRSSVMVERIDVSARCNLAKMRSHSDIVTISVPMICTQQSVGASTSYKRWSKCTMEKYGGLQPFFRNLIGKISLL